MSFNLSTSSCNLSTSPLLKRVVIIYYNIYVYTSLCIYIAYNIYIIFIYDTYIYIYIYIDTKDVESTDFNPIGLGSSMSPVKIHPLVQTLFSNI